MKYSGIALTIVGFLGFLSLVSSKSVAIQESSVLADHEDAKLKVVELIAKYGYPVEEYNVTTADGYILTIHRIPYSPKCGKDQPSEGKRVIWLQHGLLGDSANWIVAGPEKGLAYNLADECYDVWMGNYRGNKYGRNHVVFNPDKDKEKFWSFSWNEMGHYDIPAFIDFTLNKTGVEQIYYVGHSMGTTAFWVCMSERPEYNSKIKLMNAYAPVSYTEHMISPIALLSTIDGLIEWLAKMVGIYEFLPTSPFYEWLGRSICKETSPIQDICNNVLFLVAGYNFDQLDRELLPTILGHVPAGASVRTLVHYSQGVSSGEFKKYDFGSKAANREAYGQEKPPHYDLKRVTAPVALWWGQNDWLGAAADTHRIAELLPNVQIKYRINHDKYNHLDFLWAKDNLPLLNRPTIEFMKNF